MARSSSAILSVAFVLVAAYLVAQAFVSPPVPRAAPDGLTAAALAAGGALPLLASEPALAAQDRELPGAWPLVIVFIAGVSAFVAPAIILGKRGAPPPSK
eukprot:TRINITY_DN4590_c0_g2_i1.p1 TRINITY_DN4590_c0_g2~~TRINITY_DN4590_c0_g2_i1.p1  ORF type:complete len:100 (-),score=21.37 TRINITY_DN4590_c0_g2_i1:133-432(-)